MSKSFCFIPSSSNRLIYHRRVVEESWTAAAASLLRSADRSDRARSSLANKTKKKNQHCIFDCHCQGLYNTNGVLYNALAPVVEPPKLHPSPPTTSSLHKSGSVSTLAHLLFFKVDFFFARLSQNRFEPTGQPVLRRGLLDRSWRRRRRHRNLARSSNKQ